jgi:pyridoxamine 5'-phosphate oxidase family protein
MSVFSDHELAYPAEGRLGRLATVDPAGFPHVVPVGWRHFAGLDRIYIGVRKPEATQKVPERGAPRESGVRGRRSSPSMAAPDAIMSRGTAKTIPARTSGATTEDALIRITPRRS